MGNGGIITRLNDNIKSKLTHYVNKGFGSAKIVVELHLGELNNEEIELIKGITSRKSRADIAILGHNGFQKSSDFDIYVVSPTCNSNIDQEIPKVIAKLKQEKTLI